MAGDLRAKLKNELDRYRNRDFLKAMMAVCALTALADGEFNIAEKYEVERIIDTTDVLRVFDSKKVVGIFDDYVHAIRNEERGRVQKVLNNKIARFATDYKGSRTLLRAAYLVMAADGEITADELAEFNRIALLLEHQPDAFWATKDRWI
jgi:tellurite resistance protein TerB